MTTTNSRPAAEGGEAPLAGRDKPAVDLDDQAANWLAAYRAAEAQEKHWAAVKANARTQLEQRLGDAEEGRLGGQVAVRWSWVAARRLDQHKLKQAMPDLVEDYMVDSVSRRFTVVGES